MRTPPHDIEAERSLLASMVHSPEALAQAIELVTTLDLYDHGHRDLFDAMCRLYDEGVDVRLATLVDAGARPDAVTAVTAARPSSAPATVERLATIVVEHATRRRFLDAALEFAEESRGGEVPVEVLDRHIARLERIHLPLSGSDKSIVLDELLDRPDEQRSPWVVQGLLRRDWRAIVVAAEGAGKALDIRTPIPTPTGWTTMGELRIGQQVFDETGAPCTVKAATPVQLGRECFEVVFSDGSVLVADADHQWWTFQYKDRQPGRWTPSVSTTAEVASTLRARGGHTLNHAVPTCGPLQYPDADLPVDPYVLGVWLGDGTTATGGLTCADREIIGEIEAVGYDVHKNFSDDYGWVISTTPEFKAAFEEALSLHKGGLSVRHAEERAGLPNQALYHALRAGGVKTQRARMVRGDARGESQTPVRRKFVEQLRDLGVLGNKHVPVQYLTGSVAQRLALLQGLMDTDGTVSNRGNGVGRGAGTATCEFSVTCERLAIDVHRLVQSLGIKARLRKGDAVLAGQVIGTRWRISFQTDLPVFRLTRKAERLTPLRTRRAKTRYVADVRPVASRPVRCIQVDSPNNVYLAGEACIPTHNTLMLQQIALCASQGVHPFSLERGYRPVNVLLVDVENPEERIQDGCRPIREVLTRKCGEWTPRTRIWPEPGGINLRSRADIAALEVILSKHRPELVCMGPVYKLADRASNEPWDEHARSIQTALDKLRTRYKFALLLEDHAPQGDGTRRDLRPFGSSMWLRWPELGIKLVRDANGQDVTVEHWRGARMANSWPDALHRGGSHSLPWVGYWKDGALGKAS